MYNCLRAILFERIPTYIMLYIILMYCESINHIYQRCINEPNLYLFEAATAGRLIIGTFPSSCIYTTFKAMHYIQSLVKTRTAE